jgi:cell division protein FtsA
LDGRGGGALKELGFHGPVGRQVVLTGGGAELKGIAIMRQACSGRASGSAGRAGSRAARAHSGRLSTLRAGPVRASDPRRLRQVPNGRPRQGRRRQLVQRLIAAFRLSY